MRSRGKALGWRFSAGKYNPNPLTEWSVFSRTYAKGYSNISSGNPYFLSGKNRGVLRHPPISALCFVPVGVIKEGAG